MPDSASLAVYITDFFTVEKDGPGPSKKTLLN